MARSLPRERERELTHSKLQWKEFYIKDLFKITDGYYNKKPPLTKNGTYPFLGATQTNNGITEYYDLNTINKYDKVGNISLINIEKRLFKGNCIVVTNNGSVGKAYYQKSSFTCSHDVTPLYLSHYILNEYIAQFIIPLLENAGKSFEYAKKWRPKRMRSSKIILPVTSDGTPHWQLMENHMRHTENKTIARFLAHLINNEKSVKP